MYEFFDEVKIGRWHPEKILVSWDVSVYYVSQEVAVASFFLSLMYPRHDPGVWWLSSSPGAGCGCGVGCMAGAVPIFICVFFGCKS